MLKCVEKAVWTVILPKYIFARIKRLLSGYFKYKNILRCFRHDERCLAMEKMMKMEKIKKVMSKDEMKLILMILFGVVALCFMISAVKLVCRKKKRKNVALGEMCEQY